MISLPTLFVLVATATLSEAQCPEEYSNLTPDHTMCLTDKGVDIPVTTAVRDQVLARHNEIRAAVSPAAANMLKLAWNDNLAAVAGKLARQCKLGHDTKEQRAEWRLPGVYIGQNAAAGYSSLLAATNGWNSEIVNFTYGVSTNKINGHYTQIIFANTALVGCGEANCTSVPGSIFDRYQVCNYAPGQSGSKVDTEPYVQSSTACSACGTCDDNGKLCDCNGKICYNGGQLNLTSCECGCSTLFSGDLCQTKNCPEEVEWICNYYFDNYPPDPCNQFSNVIEECPRRCGFCTVSE